MVSHEALQSDPLLPLEFGKDYKVLSSENTINGLNKMNSNLPQMWGIVEKLLLESEVQEVVE